MQLLRIFSHNPQSGSIETTYLTAPQDKAVQLDAATRAKLEQRLREEFKRTHYPVELGFHLETLKEIYVKPQLLDTKARINALYKMYQANELSAKELLKEINFEELNSLRFAVANPAKSAVVLTKGMSGFPGAINGRIVHTIAELEQEPNAVWVLGRVTNAETKVFNKAKAIVLTKSGATSHAAILARNLMLPLIMGGEVLSATEYKGEKVTIDGSTGIVFRGHEPVTKSASSELAEQIRELCFKESHFEILANAETEVDVKKSLDLGAAGIGLCRTEHMFQETGRLDCVKEILFSESPSAASYNKLLQFQKQDFTGMFKLLPGKKIVVRYLDAPLHEFGGEAEENPMLGFRGIRMSLRKPELTRIQTRAIFEALADLQKAKLELPRVLLEMPMVCTAVEMAKAKQLILAEFAQLQKEFPELPEPEFAAMLETPRACLNVAELAREVDYFSFGTNDLTQMSFGLSRDDTRKLIADYVQDGLLEADPFVSLDNVLLLFMQETILKARKVNPKAEFSICGEQAGDSKTISRIKALPLGTFNSLSVSPGKLGGTIFWAAKS